MTSFAGSHSFEMAIEGALRYMHGHSMLIDPYEMNPGRRFNPKEDDAYNYGITAVRFMLSGLKGVISNVGAEDFSLGKSNGASAQEGEDTFRKVAPHILEVSRIAYESDRAAAIYDDIPMVSVHAMTLPIADLAIYNGICHGRYPSDKGRISALMQGHNIHSQLLDKIVQIEELGARSLSPANTQLG